MARTLVREDICTESSISYKLKIIVDFVSLLY